MGQCQRPLMYWSLNLAGGMVLRQRPPMQESLNLCLGQHGRDTRRTSLRWIMFLAMVLRPNLQDRLPDPQDQVTRDLLCRGQG